MHANVDPNASNHHQFSRQPSLGYQAPVVLVKCDAGAGTIEANVEIVAEPHFYHRNSEALIRGAPISAAFSPRASRAQGLIAEINAISAQIQEIMSQVERAVSHLATSG